MKHYGEATTVSNRIKDLWGLCAAHDPGNVIVLEVLQPRVSQYIS